MPELWRGMGWKVLVHLPLRKKVWTRFWFCGCLPGDGRVGRELGGMVADKQADLEVPYWVADEGPIEVMKVV